MRTLARFVFCFLLILLIVPVLRAEEPDDSQIIERILRTREQILKTAAATNASSIVFLAIWDFDGTILKGDCSEGLRNGEQTVYPGLAQVAIEHGLSEMYPRAGGFQKVLD